MKEQFHTWYQKNAVEFNYKGRVKRLTRKSSWGRSAKPGKIEWLNR